MERIALLIKTNFPDYKELANDAFKKDYFTQWRKPMYQKNPTFESLKEQYGNSPLNREAIIKLFMSQNYYEGFLCAMVWGNMGTYRGGKKRFDDVFSYEHENIIRTKINNVVKLLYEGNLKEAYLSLWDKEKNGIKGIGEAFFTKLLYFAGAQINEPQLHPKPFIFDRNMRIIYETVLSIIGSKKPQKTYGELYIDHYWRIYLDYCNKIEELRRILDLPTAGYVEALLFNPKIRESLKHIGD